MLILTGLRESISAADHFACPSKHVYAFQLFSI